MRCAHAGVLFAVILMGSLPRLSAAEPPALDATKVVVRSKSEFSDALEAALHPLLADSPERPVLFVLDVTANVRKNIDKLAAGLRTVGARHPGVATWSFALLGERALKPTKQAEALATAVTQGVGTDTASVSTLAALATTLKRSKIRDSAIVYINDWRFEDDADLEGFIKDLKRRGNGFSIVGSEASFGRAWNDGWVSADDRFDVNDPSGMKIYDYHEGIGRSPFAKGDHESPWHGGDTAYPHAPYRWPISFWQFEFTEHDFTMAASKGIDALADLLGPGGVDLPGGEAGEPPDFEELERRLREGGGLPPKLEDLPSGFDKDANRYFPLPAAYGPYGLMRTAAMTGGRYVLWSWNPGGRRKVHYEYSRCNLFPPNLRSRKAILKSLRKNPLAAAMLKAWSALEAAEGNVIEHTAPVKANLRTAQSIDRFPSGSGKHMPLSWHNKGEWRAFQRAAGEALEALEEAGAILDKALKKAAKDTGGRRERADAELFRHGVRVVHLEIANGLTASQSLPANAWSNGDKIPGVIGRTWIRQGHDPEAMRLTDQVPADTEQGELVRKERKVMLTRYRGTPFAEIVGLNDVEPLQFTWWEIGGTMPDIGRSPTESDGRPKPGQPGSPSSGGGGPTTGK